jgi:hypothetical protein
LNRRERRQIPGRDEGHQNDGAEIDLLFTRYGSGVVETGLAYELSI